MNAKNILLTAILSLAATLFVANDVYGQSRKRDTDKEKTNTKKSKKDSEEVFENDRETIKRFNEYYQKKLSGRKKGGRTYFNNPDKADAKPAAGKEDKKSKRKRKKEKTTVDATPGSSTRIELYNTNARGKFQDDIKDRKQVSQSFYEKNGVPKSLRGEFAAYALRVNQDIDKADVSILLPAARANYIDKVRFEKGIFLVLNGYPDKALPLLKAVYETNPKKGNVNYWLGRAYFEAYNNRERAIPFLQKAVYDTRFKYKYKKAPKYKEAPMEVYYYLAAAYHRAGKFDQAIRTGEIYITLLDKKGLEQFKPLTELLIEQCRTAKKMEGTATGNLVRNMGSDINTFYADYNAILSKDKTELFFNSAQPKPDGSDKDIIDYGKGKYYDDIYTMTLDDANRWANKTPFPKNSLGNDFLGDIIKQDKDVLYCQQDIASRDFFFSSWAFDEWQEPIPMQPFDITLLYGDYVTMNEEGTIMVFASDNSTKGAKELVNYGGTDLYFIRKLADGLWTAPTNLGQRVNGPYNEDYPYLTPDGKTLYFCSNGTTSMGGFDIFKTELTPMDEWSDPENMLPPINTVYDDISFSISQDQTTGYLSRQQPGGYGDLDIYEVDFKGERLASGKAIVNGTFNVETDAIDKTVYVELTNLSNREKETFRPNARTGKFSAALDRCTPYRVAYFKQGDIMRQEEFTSPCENQDLILPAYRTGQTGLAKYKNYVDTTLENTSIVSGNLNFQVLINGEPYLMENAEINYLDENDQILQSLALDRNGEFAYFSLPSKGDYYFEIEVRDLNICDQIDIVLEKNQTNRVGGYNYKPKCFKRRY